RGHVAEAAEFLRGAMRCRGGHEHLHGGVSTASILPLTGVLGAARAARWVTRTRVRLRDEQAGPRPGGGRCDVEAWVRVVAHLTWLLSELQVPGCSRTSNCP